MRLSLLPLRRNLLIDVAEFGFAFDSRLAEAGAQRVNSALNAIEAKADKVIATVKKIGDTLSNISKLGGQLQSIGTGITLGLTAPLLATAIAASNAAIKLDTAKRALTAVSGSAAEAQRQLGRLRDIAKLPGIDFQQAIEGSTRLQAIGVDARTAERALKGFANAIAQTGGGAAQLQSVTVQLSQLATKSKILAGDLRPIIEAAPVVGRLVAQRFGTVDSEAISEKLSKAGTTNRQFINQLLDDLDKLPKVLGGAREVFDNFRISVDTALAGVGDSMLKVYGPAIEYAGSVIDKFGEKYAALPPAIQTTIVVLGTVAAVLGPLIALFGTGVVAIEAFFTSWVTLSAALSAGGAAAGALGILTGYGPILLAIGAALGVVTAAWLSYQSATEKALAVTNDQLTGQVQQLARSQDLSKALNVVADAQLDAAAKSRALQSVILSLDPATRGYISALDSQQKKMQELQALTEQQVSANKLLVNAQINVLIDGLEEQKRAIDDNERAIKGYVEAANRATIAGGFAAAKIGDLSVAQAAQRRETIALGQAIDDTNKATVKSREQIVELGGKVNALDEALKKSGLSFEGQAKAAGLTTQQINLLKDAQQQYITNQNSAKTATDATTKAINEQEVAIRGLAAAARGLDVKGINEGIAAKLAEIRNKAIQNKSGVRGALSLLKEEQGRQLPGDNPDKLTLGDALKRKKEIEAIDKAYQDALNPSQNKSGAKSAIKKAERDARELFDAKRSLLLASIKQQADLVKEGVGREQALLKDSYDRGLIDTATYYDNRRLLAETAIEAEIKALNRQELLAQRDLSKTKQGTAARIQVEERLAEILADRRKKERELVDQTVDAVRETEKAFERLANSPLGAQIEVKAAKSLAGLQVNEALRTLKALEKEARAIELRTANQRNVYNQFGDAFDRAGLLERKLRTEERDIQEDIYRGVLSEAEGRARVLKIQRQYRGELLAAYEAQRDLAIALGQVNRVSELEEQIQQVRQLGVELSNTQRFLRGLGDTVTYGDLFETLGSGLRDTISDAFEDGFDSAGKSFLKLLKKMAVELATSEVIKVLRQLFNPSATSSPGVSGGAAPQSLQSGAAAGGSYLNQILGLGGDGYAPTSATTPTYNGSPIPGGGGGSTGGQLPGLNFDGFRKVLSKIPGLGKLFGSGGNTYAGTATGSLGDLPRLPGVKVPPIGGGAAAAAPSALASLGASGLLLGSGLGGQLLGGDSQIGRLLGFGGGTLAAGALGASGLLGGGIQALLPAFFSNPITAAIGIGLLGTALAFRLFGNRDFKKFKSAVQGAYQIKVDDKQPGKALFEQIKELGEQAFGKGSLKSRLNDIIRLEQAKEAIAGYGESTGQLNSSLVKEFKLARELGDPNHAANSFTRRAYGGGVQAGRGYIVADRYQPEIFVPKTDGHIFPSMREFARELILSQPARPVSSTPASGESRGVSGGELRILIAAIEHNTEVLDRLGAVPLGSVVMPVLRNAKRELGEIVEGLVDNNTSLRSKIADTVSG
jgi:tape measure domain-containing protein